MRCTGTRAGAFLRTCLLLRGLGRHRLNWFRGARAFSTTTTTATAIFSWPTATPIRRPTCRESTPATNKPTRCLRIGTDGWWRCRPQPVRALRCAASAEGPVSPTTMATAISTYSFSISTARQPCCATTETTTITICWCVPWARRAIATGLVRGLLSMPVGRVSTPRCKVGEAICRTTICGLHFGLGKAERVDRLEVRWPSGVVQVLSDIAADQVLTVVEPRQ